LAAIWSVKKAMVNDIEVIPTKIAKVRLQWENEIAEIQAYLKNTFL